MASDNAAYHNTGLSDTYSLNPFSHFDGLGMSNRYLTSEPLEKNEHMIGILHNIGLGMEPHPTIPTKHFNGQLIQQAIQEPHVPLCPIPSNGSIKMVNVTEAFWIVNTIAESQIISVFQILLGIGTIIGNPLVISSVFVLPKKERGLHKYTKASLAFADFLSGIATIAIALLDHISFCGTASHTLCMIVTALVEIFLTISFYHLCFMSFFRCRAIASPMRYKELNGKRLNIALMWLWGFPFLIIPLLFLHKPIPNIEQHDMDILIFIMRYCANSWLPYIITITFTLVLYIIYRTQSGAPQYPGEPNEVARKREKENHRIVRTICLVVVGYSITCLPYLSFTGYVLYRVLKTPELCCPCQMFNNIQGTLCLTNGITDILVYR